MDLKRFWEQFSNWELWPFSFRYINISPIWAWYCLRARSPWFFSSSNPTLTFGGFEGEPKKEMYDLLPEGTYPKTTYIHPTDSFEEVKNKISAHNFSYPFCVKPDVGMKGLLFRKIDNEAQLQQYHQVVKVDYLVQDLILFPLEISVFYYRFPNKEKGKITGFIQKDLMEIMGDGESCIIDLIKKHPKAKFRVEEMEAKHADQLNTILPKGEKYILTHAANLSRGAIFKNLKHLIDDDLLNVFDELSHKTKFYYGRYDIKCASIEDLKKGKNYSILEFNGSGAEPNHVFNSGYSLLGAQKVFVQHWEVLYQISKFNHEAGIRYWPLLKGWHFLKASRRHLKKLEVYESQVLF